jgi:hypothetical protein
MLESSIVVGVELWAQVEDHVKQAQGALACT